MRPATTGMLTAIAMMTGVTGTKATEPTPTLDAIRARGEIEVCIWPDYYAISFRNPRNGQLTGIDVDLAGELASDLGVKLRFADTSFARFMDDLEQKKCDIAMFGIGQTLEREKRVDLTTAHLKSGIYAITTRGNRHVHAWQDIDREGRVVAVQAGTFMEPFMKENLKHARLLSVATPGAREEAVLSGRADVFMTDYPYAQRMQFQHDWAEIIAPPAPVAETRYGFAVRKDDKAWLARVNAFVETIRTDGRLRKAAEKHKLLPIVVAP